MALRARTGIYRIAINRLLFRTKSMIPPLGSNLIVECRDKSVSEFREGENAQRSKYSVCDRDSVKKRFKFNIVSLSSN